jgi:CubicO group peptidase (beta-lactamase class C family)
LLLATLLAASLFTGGCGDRSPGADARSAQVDALFAPLTTGLQPGAAVMVIHQGKVVHQAGYGYADLETQVPITPGSAFRLASVSKQFTAMAVMVLVESGVLGYDDPVSRWLPELNSYEGLTVRHLMTHTGGLSEYYDAIDTTSHLPTNADAVALLGRMGTCDFAPGERFAYSNPGYDMLVPLIEAASGMSFAGFMHERLFVPIGMRRALIRDHTWPDVPGRVIGYEPDGDGFSLNDDHPLNRIVGSGGMYATLDDFFQWDQALYGETLVSRATLDEAFTPARLNNGEAVAYGFGWRLDEYNGLRRVRHGGSWVGFRTHIARYPDARFSVVILSNRADFDPEAYVDPITDTYLGTGER